MNSLATVMHSSILTSLKPNLAEQGEHLGYTSKPTKQFKLEQNGFYLYFLICAVLTLLYVGVGVLIPPQDCHRERLLFVAAMFFCVCLVVG
jgi:hypothetical protein